MEFTTYSTQETEKLAQQLAQKVKPGMILALYGELGSGKTTFTSFLVKALGFDNRVQSPTFVLIRHYKKGAGDSVSKLKSIYHVDLYRIMDASEVEDLGIEELFEEKDALVIIEWPELLENYLPENTVKIYFTYLDENSRGINVQNLS